MRVLRPVRVASIGGIAPVLAAAVFVLVSYRHPPLTFTGGTTGISGKAGDLRFVGWDLRNSGWFPARITEVAISGYEGIHPRWTVGAISRQTDSTVWPAMSPFATAIWGCP
ncbi:MAG: hypothetical protein ACYC5Y_16165 [Symbiobacteriia bacterium]